MSFWDIWLTGISPLERAGPTPMTCSGVARRLAGEQLALADVNVDVLLLTLMGVVGDVAGSAGWQCVFDS